MSGRLIILPKKSYCPWKPENVERVLRDERLERERVEREQAQVQEQESKQRLSTLKGTRQQHDSSKHVNLFEPEERAMLEATVKGEERQKQVGIMPVRLDSVQPKHHGDKPFYKRSSVVRNDQRIKADMDPMKDFVRQQEETEPVVEADKNKDEKSSHSSKRRHHWKRSSRRHYESSDSEESSRRRRRKRDRKKKKKHSSSSKRHKSEHASIEELRRRREERERTESEREAALLRDSRNGQYRRYQDQFHPGLSRR